MLYQLLPPGTAFTNDPNSNNMKLLDALAQEFVYLEEATYNVIAESNPSTMVNTLSVRYNEAGLPDPCRGVPPTFQEQRNEVVTRWRSVGGSSINYFKSVAATYGYVVTIKDRQYPRFLIETTKIETSGIEDVWVFTWDVHYYDTNTTYFRAGESTTGEQLQTTSLVDVTCLFDRLKPAHTNIIYTPESDTIFVDITNRIGTTFTIGTGVLY